MVMADPDRLRQAVGNLLANALRHAPGSRIVAEVSSIEDEGRWAAITVSDEGPGISSDLRPRLFERFTVGGKSHGLGLGLYLVRQIAEAHGGQVSLDERYQNGARFRVMIPQVD
jgi:signal transduction histidine kinase